MDNIQADPNMMKTCLMLPLLDAAERQAPLMMVHIVDQEVAERVKFASNALKAAEYDFEYGCNYDDGIIDLMTDLMHLLHDEGLSIDSAISMARNNYLAERRELH